MDPLLRPLLAPIKSSEWSDRLRRIAALDWGLVMATSLEQALIDVWRQVLVEDANVVVLDRKHYPVRQTSKSRLHEVDFVFEGKTIRGLEQNPETKSRWAEMARAGEKVMQFLSDGRYLANVVGGKLTFYGRREE